MSHFLPQINTVNGFCELYTAASTAPNTASESAITFDVASPGDYLNKMQDDDGWIDVRGFNEMTIVINVSDNDVDIILKSKKTTHASAEDMVASATYSTSSTSQTILSSEDISDLAWVQILHHNTVDDSVANVMAEVLLKNS